MMKTMSLSGLVLAFLVSTGQAADVEIKGAHLCCGACTRAVGKVLGRVNGVSDAACDREGKTIKFKATDAKVARQAARRLMNAGFYGQISVDGKAVKLRTRGPKPGEKADSVTLYRLHLCCGGCVKAASKAAKSVNGVESVTADRKKRTLTITGSQFEVAGVIEALNKAGFAASTRGGKKKKQK